MRKIRVLTKIGLVLLLFITTFYRSAEAQSQNPGSFDLKNGDRVVFLGNSLFENDFQYGYLELALTTRFANRDVTFRNLGWSGDDVWGEARSTFTNPPTAYQHLIQNITAAKPSVVFLAYGGIEAQEGEAGLSRFKDGLNKLLDKIDSLGARTILLSPIPVISSDTSINVAKRNADIELYSREISNTAAKRGKAFIDIYNPIWEISKKTTIIENGVHLNEIGYYYLATILEKGLALKSEKETIVITVEKQGTEISPNAKKVGSGKELGDVNFTLGEQYLPLPLTLQNDQIIDTAPILRITGLKKGFYTLATGALQIVSASAKEWEKGVEVKQGPSYEQAAELREIIQKKNDLHFFQYRPMNETYIIGFRSYEQGKHVKDLEDQNILITWLESQISFKKKPKEIVYRLVELK